jgi:hypothetical protein
LARTRPQIYKKKRKKKKKIAPAAPRLIDAAARAAAGPGGPQRQQRHVRHSGTVICLLPSFTLPGAGSGRIGVPKAD